jgi:hypothetical protein
MLGLLEDKRMKLPIGLFRVATSLANFHNFTDIPTCIIDVILNEMR